MRITSKQMTVETKGAPRVVVTLLGMRLTRATEVEVTDDEGTQTFTLNHEGEQLLVQKEPGA